MYIVRFIRRDGKPDEEYFYRALGYAEQHVRVFEKDRMGDYERIELRRDRELLKVVAFPWEGQGGVRMRRGEYCLFEQTKKKRGALPPC